MLRRLHIENLGVPVQEPSPEVAEVEVGPIWELQNRKSGASWVSIHNGGGVGIGYSQHAGMVVLADGTEESDRRLERVLTSDPGLGVIRHADAGYEEAIRFAKEHGIARP